MDASDSSRLAADHEDDALKDKIAVLVLVGSVSFACGVLPLIVSRASDAYRRRRMVGASDDSSGHQSARAEVFMSCVLCLGSGVLLATIFTHMLPEIQSNFAMLHHHAVLPSLSVPLGEVTFCCGFLMVYFIEELVRLCLMSSRRCSEPAVIAKNSYSTFEDADTLKDRLTSHHPADTPDASTSPSSTKEQNPAGAADVTATTTGQESSDLLRKDAPPADHCHGVDLTSIHVFRTYLIVLALSVHSVFEGLAVAFEASSANVWALFVAIISHKSIINFCLGEQLLGTGRSTCFIVSNMAILSFSSSLGVLLGVLVNQLDGDVVSRLLATAFLQSLAAGTILYVVFFELLGPERLKPSWGLLKFLAVLLGFVLMLVLQSHSMHSM